MRKPPKLYLIQAPVRLVARNVLPLKGNVRGGRGAILLVDAPPPPDRSWRELIRRLTRDLTRGPKGPAR